MRRKVPECAELGEVDHQVSDLGNNLERLEKPKTHAYIRHMMLLQDLGVTYIKYRYLDLYLFTYPPSLSFKYLGTWEAT